MLSQPIKDGQLIRFPITNVCDQCKVMYYIVIIICGKLQKIQYVHTSMIISFLYSNMDISCDNKSEQDYACHILIHFYRLWELHKVYDVDTTPDSSSFTLDLNNIINSIYDTAIMGLFNHEGLSMFFFIIMSNASMYLFLNYFI